MHTTPKFKKKKKDEQRRTGAVITSLSSGSSLQSSLSLPLPNLSQFPWLMSCTISATGLQRETKCSGSHKRQLVRPETLLQPSPLHRNMKSRRLFFQPCRLPLVFHSFSEQCDKDKLHCVNHVLLYFYFFLFYVVPDRSLIWVRPQGGVLKCNVGEVAAEQRGSHKIKPWRRTTTKYGCHWNYCRNFAAYCIQKVVRCWMLQLHGCPPLQKSVATYTF